jgi:hypothetical protein
MHALQNLDPMPQMRVQRLVEICSMPLRLPAELKRVCQLLQVAGEVENSNCCCLSQAEW